MVRADPASTEAPAATDPGHEGAPAPSSPAQETVKVTQYWALEATRTPLALCMRSRKVHYDPDHCICWSA